MTIGNSYGVFVFVKVHWILISSLLLFFALLLRWPTVPFIDSAPLDANFPLHALAAKALSEGSWTTLPYLQWPEGAPVRYIAWPILLLAIPFTYFLSAIASMNISVFLWIWLQGLGGYWIGTKLDLSIKASLFLALGCMFAPTQIIAMGNGQYENMALFPLCWFYSSLRKKQSCFLPFALCLFSSPYQAVASLLAIPICIDFKKITRAVYIRTFEISLLLVAGYLYYKAVSQGAVHESVTPAPSVLSEKALPSALFLPVNIAESGGVPLSGPFQRIAQLTKLPVSAEYNHRWPWVVSTAGSYIGWTFWLGALCTFFSKSQNKKLLYWAGLCLTCALGATLGETSIPLPWSLSEYIPGLMHMQATSRFLSGLTAALVLYIALNQKKFIVWLLPLIVFEGLLISPAHWPIPARAPIKASNIDSINKPIAFWPAAPVIASHKVTMTALMLEQPLALFHEKNISMPDAKGIVQYSTTRTDHQGRSPNQWKNDLCSKGLQDLIQFRDIVGDNGQPFFYGVQTMNQNCKESFCRWTLCSD